jgi:hypothetical protein
MFLKLIEVYEEVMHHGKVEGQKFYSMRDVVINKHFIAFMRDDAVMSSYLKDGRLPEVLNKEQKFTRISISRGNIGQDIVVIGDLEHISNLFSQELDGKRKALKG